MKLYGTDVTEAYEGIKKLVRHKIQSYSLYLCIPLVIEGRWYNRLEGSAVHFAVGPLFIYTVTIPERNRYMKGHLHDQLV